MKFNNKQIVLAACAGLALVVSSCGKRPDVAAIVEGIKNPPPPSVNVAELQPQTLPLEQTISARLEASRKAVVISRASGVLKKRVFEEGSEVKEGDVLFELEDDIYRQTVSKAAAAHENARRTLDRLKPLADAGAVSRQAYDQARQAFDVTKADLESARINLGYTRITAPISGRIGKSLVSEGSLISPASGPLAVIQQYDPLYVNLSQSAGDYMRALADASSGKVVRQKGMPSVKVTLDDGTVYPLEGKLLFIDPSVNESTGMVAMKAEIPNPADPQTGAHALLPGLMVNATFSLSSVENAYSLPKSVVNRGAEADTVKLVSGDGEVSDTPIGIAGDQNGQWVVTSGLNPGDRIMVNGFAQLRPGQRKVTPTLIALEDYAQASVDMNSTAPAGAAESSAKPSAPTETAPAAQDAGKGGQDASADASQGGDAKEGGAGSVPPQAAPGLEGRGAESGAAERNRSASSSPAD